MPVEDRAADTWEPLVVIADLAGGEWPALARTACRVMTDYEAGQDEEGGLRTRLLVGIRRAFAAENDPVVLGTRRLLKHLTADKEAPWAEYGANGLTPRGLQLLLQPYGISSANRRFPDGTQAKGFARNQFLDTWARYCPEPAPAARAHPARGRAPSWHVGLTRLVPRSRQCGAGRCRRGSRHHRSGRGTQSSAEPQDHEPSEISPERLALARTAPLGRKGRASRRHIEATFRSRDLTIGRTEADKLKDILQAELDVAASQQQRELDTASPSAV